MGRVTLNVLLSFAQFEREVTGERIRDKIAASKEKGMWMGGRVPVGYDAKERKLIVNAEEADFVRRVFRTRVPNGITYSHKSVVNPIPASGPYQGIKSLIYLENSLFPFNVIFTNNSSRMSSIGRVVVVISIQKGKNPCIFPC